MSPPLHWTGFCFIFQQIVFLLSVPHFLLQVELRAKKHVEMLTVICYWSSMKILWFPGKIELVKFSVSQLLLTGEHQWSASQTRRIKQGTSHCTALSVFKHGVSCINSYKLATVVWILNALVYLDPRLFCLKRQIYKWLLVMSNGLCLIC